MPPRKLKGSVRDELVRCVAVYCYAAVHERVGMQLKDQRKLVETMFHGTHGEHGMLAHKELVAAGNGKKKKSAPRRNSAYY